MEQKANIKEVECYYHYTTQETLCSMLNKYREDISNGAQENLIFWASSIFTMNDPQEMKYGRDKLEKILNFDEEFYQILNEYRLNMSSAEFDKVLYDYSHTPYVLSFSTNRDDLAMWAMYGNEGRGVALKFNKYIQSVIPGAICSSIKEVNYDEGIRYEILQDIYNKGITEWTNQQDENVKKKIKERTLSEFYARICSYYKTKGYSKENEYRINFFDVPFDKIRFRSRDNMIVPYIEAPVSVSYLEEIIIGPCFDFNEAKITLGYLLKCCDLERIVLSKSDIPYRNI